jgi:hypothetical protein
VERKAWKMTKPQYSDRLDTELLRMKVRAATLTLNEAGSRNPSVALYFTRPPAADDFSWQDTLGISNPDPTVPEIEEKFRAMLKGLDQSLVDADRDLRYQLNEARKRALAFATGNYGKENELAIACDKFTEVRWNICAIAMTLNFLRRLDDIGSTDIINRAYSGFRAELTEGVNVV